MTTDVPGILVDLVARPAWAMIRLKGADEVLLVGGTPTQVESLLDVPLEEGVPAPGRQVDRLLAVPFRQVAERGFEAHDDGAPLTVVDVDLEVRLPLADVLAALPEGGVSFLDRGGFETTDEEYADVVRQIID